MFNSTIVWRIAPILIAAISLPLVASAKELAVEDFKFDGPSGSDIAKIEKVGKNHFTIVLGTAPQVNAPQPDWVNMLQFEILRNAKGNSLRLDVRYDKGSSYRFNHYFYSWSYDSENWMPMFWGNGKTLNFPVFTQDKVYFGHQVPFSYEKLVELIEKWKKNSAVKVHVLGKSNEGRNLYRLEITDPKSSVPEEDRWVHHVSNQHPGEHNSQWRMVGMIDWLLSEEGADCRKRSINHFVLLMAPDGPTHGWYRCAGDGADMNRSYLVGGADKNEQTHDAYVYQKDLETLMSSKAPVTDLWSMHTWNGTVEILLVPGPEFGKTVGEWTELRDVLQKNDPANELVKPLAVRKCGEGNRWNNGPHAQFGITTFLCEGAGNLYTKKANVDSGTILMKSLASFYKGTKSSPQR